MSKIKPVLSFFCCLLLIAAPCFATPATTSNPGLVTQLDKGKKAPFDGILLSDTAAAKLFAEIKFSKKECDLLLKKEVDLISAVNTGKIKSLELQLQIHTKKFEDMIAVRDDRINFLEKNYSPPAWYERNELWLTMGVVVGIGITVAAGYAIGQAK